MRIVKLLLVLVSLVISAPMYASEKISTIEFVQVLNGHMDEARYYYQNNWLKLRQEAAKLGYIDSYQLLETEPDEQASFHFVLLTTYTNKALYDKREANFRLLIERQNGLRLLNTIKPVDFRKTLFSKEPVMAYD